MSPRARRLELATGLGYNVLEWDADSDHTVVLVHGFLDMAWGWERTVRAGLEGRVHVVAPDMRGHGDSDRVGAGGYYYFLDYVADLASVIDQLGRERVSLVGHSMGGTIASYFAGVFPESVHDLALLEGIHAPEGSPGPARIRDWINGWHGVGRHAPRTYASVEEAAARLRQHDELLSADLALELAAHGTRDSAGGRVFKHDPLHLTRGPYPFRVDAAEMLWRAITCKVLLVEGGASRLPLAAADRERRQACFPGARLATLAGAGHMMQRHQPEALSELLLDFWATSP